MLEKLEEYKDCIGKEHKIKEGAEVCDKKYKLGKFLAQGGYGRVYECENQKDKVIKIEIVARPKEHFLKEIEI